MQSYGALCVGKSTISSFHHHLHHRFPCAHQQFAHACFPLLKRSRFGSFCKPAHVPFPDLNARRGPPFKAFSSLPPDDEQQLASGATGCSTLAEIKNLKSAPAKPEICTADELHYVSVPGTLWKLALWRYPPRPQAPARNHPLLLLSGVGTNAIGFDLDPSVSFARYMAEQGFDTWILEVRGAGLSKIEGQLPSSQITKANNGAMNDNEGSLIKESVKSESDVNEMVEQTVGSPWSDSKVATSLSNVFTQIIEKSKSFLDQGQSLLMSAPLLDRISDLLEDFQLSEHYDEFRERLIHILNERQNSAVTKQIVALSNRLLKLLEDGQRAVSPPLSDLQDRLISARQIADLQDRLIATIDDFQKLLDLVVTYDWDFDHYLEEDVPAAMDYIRDHCKSKDGKIHAVGHSMGGILLYALIASQKQNCGLASAVTLASSLDYRVSNSSLRLLLPLVDPAQALNVPAVPLGALMAAIHPLAVNPPYMMAWLSPQVSAQDMMDPELFKKLVLNNFCTIPAKLLLQLTTVFQPGGLRNRTGTVFHKDHLYTSTTPVLAIAGDEDLVCPPAVVLDTVKVLPEGLVEYKLFGGHNNVHYGHYDLVCGRLARQEIYPCIEDFLTRHDSVKMSNQ